MAIIAFDSVSKAYQNKTVLHDFSLVVESGQRVRIITKMLQETNFGRRISPCISMITARSLKNVKNTLLLR